MIRHIEKYAPVLTVAAPPSKSLSHRCLIAAALSGQEAIVSNLAFSEDIKATLDCLEALGYRYEREDDAIIFHSPCHSSVRSDAPVTLNCRESGSTMRFILPVALVRGGRFIVEGSGRLIERGIEEYSPVFRTCGVQFRRDGASYIAEGRLPGGDYSLDCSRSSQFLSALLLALPLCREDSRVRIDGPVCSRSYVKLTESVLEKAGIVITEEPDGTFLIPGGQKYAGRDWQVEGDWTNAAYLDAFNFMEGASVSVKGLDAASAQGDSRYPVLFEALRRDDGPVCLDDNIDLGPVLFAAAALRGHALFTGTSRLRYKESDRVTDMLSELSKFGVRHRVSDDEVEIFSDGLHAPDSVLDSHNDHRLAMALTLLAARFGGYLEGSESVCKSFPDFYNLLGI